MSAAIDLRDAALELLKREGKPRQTIEGDVVFEPHTQKTRRHACRFCCPSA